MQLPKQANQGKQEYKQLMIVSDYLSKKKKKKKKKTRIQAITDQEAKTVSKTNY